MLPTGCGAMPACLCGRVFARRGLSARLGVCAAGVSVWPGVCADEYLRGWVSARPACLRGRVSARREKYAVRLWRSARSDKRSMRRQDQKAIRAGLRKAFCAFFCTQNASPLCILTDLSSIISDPRTKCKRRHHLFPFFTRGLPTRQHAFRGFPSGAAQDDGCRCILSLTAWRRRSILTALFRRPCALIIEPAFPLVNPNILHKITFYCVFSSPGQKYIAVFP